MKKIISLLTALFLLVTPLLASCTDKGTDESSSGTPAGTASDASTDESASAEKTTIRIGGLKGPTSIGMVKLMEDDETNSTANDYDFTVAGSADELTPLLIRGELDMAAIPANLASVLYNRTEGAIQILAVNTLGVLYIVETGNSVQSLADLKGKTIYATGKGSTPEYTLLYLLEKAGLDPEKDVTVEFKSEPTEVVALLKAQPEAVAMLPQPYVTAAAAQLGEGFRAAVSLSEAWDALDNGSRCVTAGIVVRTEFAEAHPEAVEAFLAEMAESVDWVNADPADAGEICGALNIVKAPIAAKAIPNCNLVCLTGEEMISAATGTLETLFALNPSAVGGALPGEDFWFGA